MSARLELIESKLEMLNPAKFQTLCDVYFHNREKGLISISRTGSQIGKDKTVAGTPDMFYRTIEGDLIHVEATTKASSLDTKLIEDFDKCLDETITGVPPKEILRVVLCFNSRLTPAEEYKVYRYAQKIKKKIKLISLDSLALEIYDAYPYIQKDLLDIPFDTGQILPLATFVTEYDSKCNNLSTPLNNIFLHRAKEIDTYIESLKRINVTIVSGDPGVGKTKIGIEVAQRFLQIEPTYEAFVINKKDVDIYEDLKITLKSDKNYLLIIDDANKQLTNLDQILGLLQSFHQGRITILITVRNYALEEIKKRCFDNDLSIFELKKFTDQEITDILNSDSFKIRHPEFQKKIIEVADGNPRLAIMAARLANDLQAEFLFTSVYELYHAYFQHYTRDMDLFENKDVMKSFALICFFFTIDLNNRIFINKLLNVFEIDRLKFIEAIHELEKRELVEIKHNIAKVSEQVMATYIFYTVFVKDKILSFGNLLNNYFQEATSKFTDSVIAANNAFGYDNVISRIDNELNEYLISIRANDERLLKFFDVFWFYKQEEVVKYFYDIIGSATTPSTTTYVTKYEQNEYIANQDVVLTHLSKFFHYPVKNLIIAIELSFEYCRKNPSHLAELIKLVNEYLVFKGQDKHNGFFRQVEMFDLIIKKIGEEDRLYIDSFLALIKVFLGYTFHVAEGGRRMTISFYLYPLPPTSEIKDLRKRIYEVMTQLCTTRKKDVIEAMIFHMKQHREIIHTLVLEYDIPIISEFITKYLVTTNIEHIKIVQDYILWLNRHPLSDRSYLELKNKFYSKEYKYYCVLSWDKIRDKYEYEYDNYDEYQLLKAEEIKKTFIFNSIDEFELLFSTIDNLISLNDNDAWNQSRSIDIIVVENFNRDPELGFKLFSEVIKRIANSIGIIHNSIRAIAEKSDKFAQRLWDLLISWDNDLRIQYLNQALFMIPAHLITKHHTKEFIDSLNGIKSLPSIYFESIHKFTCHDKTNRRYSINQFLLKIPYLRKLIGDSKGTLLPTNSIEEIIQTLMKKISNNSLRIRIHDDIFERYFDNIKHNCLLLCELYSVELSCDFHYDYDRKGLKNIISVYPEYFMTYIKLFYCNKSSYALGFEDQLSFIWDYENSNITVEKAINMVIDSTVYWGISETPINNLFIDLDKKQKIKALTFIRAYIKKYHKNIKYMNGIFDVLNNSLSEYFNEEFKYFLSIESDVEVFKHINWIGREGTFTGDVIIGEIYASKWQRILNLIDNCKNKLDLIPIKQYVKEIISAELKSAENERILRFTDTLYK